jgi:hypothetical protein
MPSGTGKLALVPLLAVAVALGATGIHGRRTHEPERAVRAGELLAPTEDEMVARTELESFFESGLVGWDVKTGVEITCGTIRGRNVPDPLRCVAQARSLVYGHECRERDAFRTYTWLGWASLVPLLVALGVATSLLAEMMRSRRRAS